MTGNGIYSKGQAVTVRAYPSSGYRFVYWIEYGVVVSYNATYTSTVTGNRTLIAVFEQISIDSSFSTENLYRINTPAPSNGTLTVRPSVAKYGDRVTITATPYSGYTIDNISVIDRNGRSISVRDNGNDTYSFTMPNSWATVSATFAPVITQAPSTSTPNVTTIPNVSANTSTDTLWISPFSDVMGIHPFYHDVAFVVQNGLMNGVDSRHFNPDGTMTRGMIWTILARMKGIDTSNSNPWYQTGMTWAKQAGISDGTNPEANISREEFITMLWRYAGQPAAVAGPLITSGVVGDMTSYADAYTTSSWAKSAMTWAVQKGIIDGADGRLHPQDNALCVDAAVWLTRFCKRY